MEHAERYTRLSELLATGKAAREAQVATRNGKGAEVLRLIHQLVRSIEAMNINERETLMNALDGRGQAKNFEAARCSVQPEIQALCVSASLGYNPEWGPLHDR